MSEATVELVETDASAELLSPFDEQTAFDVAAGSRRLFALRRTQARTVGGSAVLGRGALDLHVAPEFRARGYGADAAAQLLELAGDGPLTAWSHEDHPAARALASRFGFERTRELLQLRVEGLDGFDPPTAATIGTFRPGVDDAEWLGLNARVFAWHPEQGGVSAPDLARRMAEPWFDPGDFLVARDDTGLMVGYNWLKVEPGSDEGEIYVIGVAPENSGQGLGRTLMNAGLARLRQRGCRSATLFVEGGNERGIRLYRSLGFVTAATHVQYSRR